MRALALHADVVVFVSEVWQTTCTAVRGGEEGFVIDSPVYPEELGALPGVLEQAGYPVSGLLATHGDWDHLLARTAFPGAALGAGEATVARLGAQLGAAQRELRAFDTEHYVAGRTPLALGSLQSLPVPGKLDLGAGAGIGAGASHELELYPADGHTADGTAFWLPWARVLVCGDYLSPVEIPVLGDGGSAHRYAETLRRLAPLVQQAEWVVPGHGAPVDARQAVELLEQDLAYLAALQADGERAPLPAGRRGGVQPRQHAANVAAIGR